MGRGVWCLVGAGWGLPVAVGLLSTRSLSPSPSLWLPLPGPLRLPSMSWSGGAAAGAQSCSGGGGHRGLAPTWRRCTLEGYGVDVGVGEV